MENTKEQKPEEQTENVEPDRNSDQQTGPKEEKREQAPKNVFHHKSSHQAGNKLSATLQKMFHTDGQSDKSKKGSDTESEKSEISNLSAPGQSKLRFQKTDKGSHIHNLLPCKKGHRVQNFLKELGIHSHNPIVEPQNLELAAVADKLHIKHSETSLSGKYGKPQEVIGKGAFGIVRIAHKTEPKVPGEKLFAVKEFKKRSNEPAKKYIKRLTSEFCISSSLHHINVIGTLDLLQDAQGTYCEVMEYCSGGDLYTLIVASGRLEQDEGNCFFGQLINGVKYLHDNGVAHRDLKPENLLLTSTGCLKITDFGNAECFRMAWESKTHLSHGICGSEPYIAPEEFTVDSFDPRLVDVWACGIIYMTMVTGRLLWRIAKEEDCNFKAYIDAKTKGAILMPLQILNKGPHEIMSRIIEPSPKHRISIEQIIEDPWFSHVYVCHRPILRTNEYSECSSSVPNTSCAINAVDQQATAANKISVSNVIL